MESVNVVARFRGAESGVDDFGAWELTETSISHKEKHHDFNFDAVLDPSRSQEELYQKAGKGMIENFMDGFNATIFAYGQSGSGKTFSMLGPEEVTEILVNQSNDLTPEVEAMFGIVPRATFHIFDIINEGKQKGIKYTIKVSYIEIYNESINDILSMPPTQNLKLREFPNQGMCVMGMQEIIANSPESVFECISAGTSNKIVCSTGQNSRSSRSHTVFIITCEQLLLDGSTKMSKINLVDLAGSEKLSKTGAQGQALKEAQKINLSLTTLGRCIKALTGKGSEHIPFRESKLTLILKESLGGNSKTTLIVTGSMRMVHQEETISTMQFAERAKMVKTSAKSNVKRSVEELELMVSQLTEETERLKKLLKEGGGTIMDSSSELQVLRAKFINLESTSTKRIEELSYELVRSKSCEVGSEHLEERRNLLSKIQDLDEELRLTKSEKETEKSVYEEFIQEISTKSTENNNKFIEATQELNASKSYIYELKLEISARDEMLTQLSQEKYELTIEKDECQEMIFELKASLTTNETKQALKNQELAETHKKLHELTAEKIESDLIIDKLEYYTKSLLDKIEGFESSSAKSTKAMEEYKDTILRLQTENQNLNKSLAELKNKSESSENSEAIKELQNENSRLRTLIRKSSKDHSPPQMEESKLTEMDQVTQLKNQLKSALQEKLEIIEALQDFKSQYDDYVSKHKHIYTEHEEQRFVISMLNEKVINIERDLQDEKENSSRLAKSVKFHEDNREKLIKDIENNIKVKMQLDINAFVKQNAELQNTLSERELELNGLKSVNKEDFNKTRAELAKSKNTISQLNSQISLIAKEFEMKIDKVFQEKEALRLANGDRISENLQLKMEIASKDTEIFKKTKLLEETMKKLSLYRKESDSSPLGLKTSPQKPGLFLIKKKAEKMTPEMIKSLYSNIDNVPANPESGDTME